METRRKNEFKLHLDVARQYAIVLPKEQDRITALKWLVKIKNTDANAQKTKHHALQLLIMCLQRKRLVGPFENGPEQDKELVDYELGSIQPLDVAKLLLAKENESRMKLPVAIDVYGDTCEFVAYQEIPHFGAHFLYAYSPEPIKTWDNIDKSIIPHGLWDISVTASPDTSILAQAVKETAEKSRRAKASEKEHEQVSRKEEEFTEASVLESSGALKELFMEEEPAVKDIDTSLIGVAISSGFVEPSEVEAAPEFKDAAEVNRPQNETVAVCKKGESNVKEKKKKSAQKEKSAKREKPVVEEQPPTWGGVDHCVETPERPKRLRKRHTKKEGRAGVCQISPEKLDIDDEMDREIKVEVVLSGSEDEMEEFYIEAEVICEDPGEGGELEDVCEDEELAALDNYCDPELLDDSLPLIDLDHIEGMGITERLNLANLLLQKQLHRYSKHAGRVGEWARDVLLEIRRRCDLGPQPDEADYLEKKLAEFQSILSQCRVPLRQQEVQEPSSRECPSNNYNTQRTPRSYLPMNLLRPQQTGDTVSTTPHRRCPRPTRTPQRTPPQQSEPCAPSMQISPRQYLSVPSPQCTPPRGFSRTPEVFLEDEEFPGEIEQSIHENDECAPQKITEPCAPSMQISPRQYLSVPSPQRTPPRGFSRTPEVFLEDEEFPGEREQSIYENDECASQMITEPCAPSMQISPRQYLSVPSPQRTPPRGFSRTPEVFLEDEEFPGEIEQSIYENDECAPQKVTEPCAPSMQISPRQYLSVPSPQRTPPRGFSRTPEVFLEDEEFPGEIEQSIYENDECAPQKITEPCAPSMQISPRQYLSVPSPQRTPPRGFPRTPEVFLEDEEFPGEIEQSIYENDECAPQKITEPCAPSMQISPRQYLSVPSPQRTPPRGFPRTPEVFLEDEEFPGEIEQSIHENDECAPQKITEPCAPSMQISPRQYLSVPSPQRTPPRGFPRTPEVFLEDEEFPGEIEQSIYENDECAPQKITEPCAPSMQISPRQYLSVPSPQRTPPRGFPRTPEVFLEDEEFPGEIEQSIYENDECAPQKITEPCAPSMQISPRQYLSVPSPQHTPPRGFPRTPEVFLEDEEFPGEREQSIYENDECASQMITEPCAPSMQISPRQYLSVPSPQRTPPRGFSRTPEVFLEDEEFPGEIEQSIYENDECAPEECPEEEIDAEEDECHLHQVPTPHISPQCTPPQRSPPPRSPLQRSPLQRSPPQHTPPQRTPPMQYLAPPPGSRISGSPICPFSSPEDMTIPYTGPLLPHETGFRFLSNYVPSPQPIDPSLLPSPSMYNPCNVSGMSPQVVQIMETTEGVEETPAPCTPHIPRCSPPQRSPPQRSPQRSPPQRSPQRNPPQRSSPQRSPPQCSPSQRTSPMQYLATPSPQIQPPTSASPICPFSTPEDMTIPYTGPLLPHETGFRFIPPQYSPPYYTDPSGAISEFLEDEECPEEIYQINDESEECELDVPSSQGPSHRKTPQRFVPPRTPEEFLEEIEFPEELDESDECVGRWIS